MAISADQTPSNRLRHTAADTPGELTRTTATTATGSKDTAVHRFGTLLDACMHQVYIIDMGLGLTISRSIIEKHGDKLYYANQPAGQHACRFTLPLHNQPAKQT